MIEGNCSRVSLTFAVCGLCLVIPQVCFCDHGAGCHKTRVHPIAAREDIAGLLQSNRFKTGAELGVERGYFSHHILQNWESCEEYILVDLWKAQENYDDIANRGISPHFSPENTRKGAAHSYQQSTRAE